jgi:hypothetical protein
MLDFTDVGLATTYRIDIAKVERKACELIDHLHVEGCGAVVVEIADGLLQRETSRLLESGLLRERLDGVIFAAADAMGAIGGLHHLRRLGLPVLGISGRLTCSPLATREAEACCDVPVFTLDQLSDPGFACCLFGLEGPSGDEIPDTGDVVFEREGDADFCAEQDVELVAGQDQPAFGSGAVLGEYLTELLGERGLGAV